MIPKYFKLITSSFFKLVHEAKIVCVLKELIKFMKFLAICKIPTFNC